MASWALACILLSAPSGSAERHFIHDGQSYFIGVATGVESGPNDSCKEWGSGALVACRQHGSRVLSANSGKYAGKTCDCPSGVEENVAAALAAQVIRKKNAMKAVRAAQQVQIVDSDPSQAKDGSKARATCPEGTWVQKCESTPANAEDGIEVSLDGKTCIAVSNGGSITAKASCGSAPTTVNTSNAIYLDQQVVSASCEKGSPIACTCVTHWSVAQICSGISQFEPTDGICSKEVPASPGRRRNVDQGAGAKIFAVCQEDILVDKTPIIKAPKKDPCDAQQSNPDSCCALGDKKEAALDACKSSGAARVQGKSITCECPRGF